jgi:hypothetical protein
MPQTPKLKKSESLEIRIPHATKAAFMARCREDGQSASEALRMFIEAHLDGTVEKPRAVERPSNRTLRLVVGALIAAAVGAAAAPSLARVGQSRVSVATSHDRSDFMRMDGDGDGVVSFAEYQRR